MTENALVHGEYMRRMKPKDPDAKTALGKWGSSYYTWCMSSDKWKLAKDFLWYDDMKGGPLRFPVMWDKRPELCGERVPALDIEGMTEFVPVKKFEAYLKAAAQWVEPRSLPIEEVLDMLRSDAVEKRIWAVRLLGARKEAEHIPTTAGAFNDDSVEVRRGAAWALGMIGGPAAIEHLQANVGDRWVRADIASALGRIGGPATVEPLARLLRDKHRDVRKHAATAMAATGSQKAIPHLVEALGDEDKPTRQAALESLIQLGSRPPKQGENALP